MENADDAVQCPQKAPQGYLLPFAKCREMKIFLDRKIIYMHYACVSPDAFFADLLKNDANNILAPR